MSRDRGKFAEAIAGAWRRSIDSIFEVGRLLMKAKEQLPHGEFGAMVQADLPFGKRTAQRLMSIADNTILTNATHASVLPSSWTTLYGLSCLPDEVLERAFADGLVTSEMHRGDVLFLKSLRSSVPYNPPIVARPISLNIEQSDQPPKHVCVRSEGDADDDDDDADDNADDDADDNADDNADDVVRLKANRKNPLARFTSEGGRLLENFRMFADRLNISRHDVDAMLTEQSYRDLKRCLPALKKVLSISQAAVDFVQRASAHSATVVPIMEKRKDN